MIILHGVTCGCGSVIAVGAVVTHNVPPYANVVEMPARVLQFRLTVETIIAHERLLYPESERLSNARLEAYQKPVNI